MTEPKATANRATRRGKKDPHAPVSFQFDGETYTAPPSDDWPFKVLGMLNRGQIEEVVVILLGEEQSAKLLERDDLTVGDINRFFDVLKGAAGTGN